MPVEINQTTIRNILTRTTGYLKTVTSHSLQPYRGCTFGNALCGVGCYVQHNGHLLQGRKWGGFLDVRINAAESYRENYQREARWARRGARSARIHAGIAPINRGTTNSGGRFSIFLSSSTDPFVPQEFRFGITRSVLETMRELPPDGLIVQTHSHRVAEYVDLLLEVASVCDLRVHVSIETDREGLPGLPPHASPVARRLEACARLRSAGLTTVVTVAPLLPIDHPEQFFARLAEVADGVVIDHFIQGDGSTDGSRTRRTPLPAAMSALSPESTTLDYRDAMVSIARRRLPGRVGVSMAGFAGVYE